MNIYCFSTLSFAKLQFKSVINKAFHKHGVASFTDAWIETSIPHDQYAALYGRIFYRCVDWNRQQFIRYVHGIVASFTDAWIETFIPKDTSLYPQSHLLQMRGLKLLPRMGIDVRKSRIFYRCVDWNIDGWEGKGWEIVASFTDAWIETVNTSTGVLGFPGRIFYRCVDWNNKNIVCRKPRNVASFTDAWIETVVVNIVNWVNMSHLLQMRGLKHSKYLIMTLSKSRIFYRCVDWNAEYILVTFKAFCRIFYRCVDWNL